MEENLKNILVDPKQCSVKRSEDGTITIEYPGKISMIQVIGSISLVPVQDTNKLLAIPVDGTVYEEVNAALESGEPFHVDAEYDDEHIWPHIRHVGSKRHRL